MVTVMQWSGREARALRDALRLSVRDFAAHTNLSPYSISDMEAKGEDAQLRPSTQRILDEVLANAHEDARQRFCAMLGPDILKTELTNAGGQQAEMTIIPHTRPFCPGGTGCPICSTPSRASDVDPFPAGAIPQVNNDGGAVDGRPWPPRLDPTELVMDSPGGLLARSAAEAMEFTCRAEASDLGPQTFEHLESVTTAMAHTFACTAPGRMFPPARWYRQRVDQFLQGRQTLRQRRQLYRYAAWFSIILGWLSNDLGDLLSAEAHCLDAWEHAWQADDGEICGWVMDTTATMAMYSNEPKRARDAALKGLAHAPPHSPAAIRLACQLTRAHGRLRQAGDFDCTLADTRRRFDQLAQHGSGLFSVDAGRIAAYAATSSIWLSRPAQAVDHAHEALAFYTSAHPDERSPTREAISRLDLGLALIAMKAPDGAAEQALIALDCERLTGTVLARAALLDSALTSAYPQLPATREIHDRYLAIAQRYPRDRQLTA